MLRITPQNYLKDLERVAVLIELLISCHPFGFQVLLGQVEAPDIDLVHEMLESRRVPMPSDFKATMKNNSSLAERKIIDFEYFSRIVEVAGGWRHINLAVNEFKRVDSRAWRIVIDHNRYVKKTLSRYGSKLEQVAWKHKISTGTVMKYRREFPVKLAEFILMYHEENLD